MDRRAAGALLALAACIASSAAAPTVSDQTALDLYDAASEGCYYNFQHYGEGDRIMTNEPCLNCTCHNRMLMCYLRVCPFTKPIGQDCTVEKRADQCCPIVTCPDVPVDLLTSTSTSSPAEYGATGLGKLDKYGCSINGKYFPEGSKVPPTPNKPCEHCYCIRNMTTCVMQECTLHVDGCTPIYHKDVCCPVRYSCDHPEDEMPLLDDMSTTVRPTPGFLLTTTTLSPVSQMTQDCVHNDQIFPDGTSIKTEKACEHCYCMKGDIVCVVQECGTPMENEGKNCTSVAPREGQCCPDTYICEGDEVTTESVLDYTTEPSIEKLITLVPPRRELDEGSGYRKEEEPITTESPVVEPEVEGSGEDFATIQPSDETKETPSIIDEGISSIEDMIGMETTPQSDTEVEKAATEPDNELNTVPSGTIEPSEPLVPKLTTVSDDKKSSEETAQTHIDIQYTTASLETKDGEIPAQTTEPAFRKEDQTSVPLATTTAKIPDYYTISESEPTKVTKEEGIETTEKLESLTTVRETKVTTPASSEDIHTEIVTEIPVTTSRDESAKEPSVTAHDHTISETPTTVVTEKSETTTLNAQENEIEDVSTTQSPGRIPGEGDCLQNGITYRNESAVPSINNCQADCKCISSIIKCDPIICSDPPEYMSNCVPTYDSSESCCPTYVCDGSKETLPPQPHSQMSETVSSTPTPALDCEGDQCEIQKMDKSTETTPSDISQTSDCGSEDCKDGLQTPIQIDVKPECASEDCGSEIKPESHEIPSTISPIDSEICAGNECQQQPIEKEDSLQPCKGDNCKIPLIQHCSDGSCKLPPESSSIPSPTCEDENCKIPTEPCQNEEDCKAVNVPKVELPCQGESCKIEPTECNEEGCKISPETRPIEPTCVGDNCKISPFEPPKVKQPCEGESCKAEPTDCNDESCKTIPVQTSPVTSCEGENCNITPTEPCQNEEECKSVNVPKVEVPCEGEACKLEPITETSPVQPSCEDDSCSGKEKQEHECTDEECKKKLTPDITEQLPSKCSGTDCLSDTSELPEQTEIPGTESSLSTQDKEIEIPSITTEYLDSTKPPEFIKTETPHTSEALGEGSTVKSVAVTELEETQTESLLDNLEQKTTEYAVIKETTLVPHVEIQTDIKHELEVTTTPTFVQDITDKEAEVSKTTEFDDSVTSKPEIQGSSTSSEEHEVVTEEPKSPEEQVTSEKTSKPEAVTEEQEKGTTPVLSDSKTELGTTEPVIHETPSQYEKEISPEYTIEPEISTIPSLDKQYTKVHTLSGEVTTELIITPTEHSVLDHDVHVSKTEMSTTGSEETSKSPEESVAIDENITTTPSEILDFSTEESRSGTPSTPESPTTSSSESDELPGKITEIPDQEIQEPMSQTTSAPEFHIDNQEPGDEDYHTTVKFDLEPSTSQPSIISEIDISDSEKPTVEIDKMSDLPTEEIFTESPDINTEEPSVITHPDEGTEQESIEPELPYIPVHPTVVDKIESTDKGITPEISLEVTSSIEHKLTTPESIPEVQTQEPSSTEHKLTTPESIQTQKPAITSTLPEMIDGTKSPAVDTEQYEHGTRATEPSFELSTIDTRKYNKDTTESSKPITTVDELTTSYEHEHPTEEKQSVSPVYSEPTTSKSLQEEGEFTTVAEKTFSTEKQEAVSTEASESHVKETESEVKLTTPLEMVTTEKLKPIETEDSQTPSPNVIDSTESQPHIPLETEKEKPEEELEKVTTTTPEQTSEPKLEFSETTPDMIELVEHPGMLDISTLPSSISDERTTISLDIEKSDDKLTTERLETPTTKIDAEKVTTTSLPSSEDIDAKITEKSPSTPSDIMKDTEPIPEQPEKVDTQKEGKPDIYDISTLKPDIDEPKPESMPAQESTEIVEIERDHTTEHPYITKLEEVTRQPEDASTERPEITEPDMDRLTTMQPKEPVTELKIEPEEGLATEEPGSGDMEFKPDVDYLTEKPEIEQVSISEQESTSMISEQPSIDEQPVTDKSVDTTQSEISTLGNEIIPKTEDVVTTVTSVSKTAIIPEKDLVTAEPEYAGTKPGDQEEEIGTESPMLSATIQEPETESSTEHKFIPGETITPRGPVIPVTEKETQEMATKIPEPELPEIESSTKLLEPDVSGESQPSTAQPEFITSEQSMTTEKESVTELSITPKTEQETPGPKEDIKPDEESLTISPEKDYTTAKPEVDLERTKETSTKGPESSGKEKESEQETTTVVTSKETITEQPITSIDRETASEVEPTERDTIPEIITEQQASVTEDTSLKSTTVVSITTETIKESSTEKMEEQATISSEPDTETRKPDISEETNVPELSTKIPYILETLIPEHVTEPQRRYTTDKQETYGVGHEAVTEPVLVDKEPSVTEHDSTLEMESGTKEPQEPEETASSQEPVPQYEMTEKATSIPFVENLDDKETSTSKPEQIDDSEKMSTNVESSSTPSSTEQEDVPEKITEASPESHIDVDKQDKNITKYTTPGYTMKDETTASVDVSETEKPTIIEEGIPVHTQSETEKPIDSDLSKDTTAPEEEFLTVTTKSTTPKLETETHSHSEDFDKTPKPQETQEETSSTPTPEVPKPSLHDVQATDEVPVPEEEGHFPPSATGGYGQEPDYEDENQPFGPGTCRYGGKVYVSAQQIPRDDPCDFCFCFRSDIICLQQSCPPPIHGCHEEPIQGFCCPRYECPVSMATTLNITTTTTTTTTTLPPHFLPHAYQGAVQRRGCQIKGHTYKVGEVVRASSGPCLHCTCGGDGQMKCDPKACTPEPMLRQMIAAAVSAKRRR